MQTKHLLESIHIRANGTIHGMLLDGSMPQGEATGQNLGHFYRTICI